MNDFLSNDQLKRLDAYWRASNYLAVGQIYLKDNPLLRKPLQPNHIKPRLLGHWGTTPGLNLIYVHLNLLITAHDLDMILITGPGHGGPAIVAQSYLEGSFTQCYPSVEQNENGILRLFRQFSWPYGLSSHVSAQIPGSIHEGGELGYSLAHAYGAAFDNPDLIVACVIGDGEAETGTLAASWHSNKFLNPRRDGAVLPILHLNGFKIANPTLLSRISEDELSALMYGYGYEPYFVEGDDASTVHQQLARTLEELLLKIREIQRRARTGSHEDAQERALWPMLVLRTPKGWTGPKLVDGQPVEGTWRAHQVPLCHFEQPLHLLQLEQWLGSYRPDELFDDDGTLMPDIAAMAPTGHRRLGANPHANGGLLLEALDLPRFTDYALPVPTPGGVQAEATRLLGGYLRDVMKRNLKAANFRLFGPDETASNRLDAVYEASAKTWMASLEAGDTNLDCDGRVMEILSEQVCEGWLEGYLLTGRHGLFSCYEAFIHIVDSMFKNKISTRYIGKRNLIAIEEEVEDVKLEIEKDENKVKAIDIALKTLEESFNEVRREVGPTLNNNIAEIFNILTEGKYEEIKLGDNYEMMVRDKSNLFGGNYLSNGALDQLYLSLRIALIEILFKDEETPIILDDAFVQYDNSRREKALLLLNEKLRGQGLIFTCHTLEKEILEKNSLEYNLITI